MGNKFHNKLIFQLSLVEDKQIFIYGKGYPVMVTLVLHRHQAVKVWLTYFPPNKPGRH